MRTIYSVILNSYTMQKRHTDRAGYFAELAYTSEKYLMPYIGKFIEIDRGLSVLEVGCGDGGNLLPFSARACRTVGIDISENRIRDAVTFFEKKNAGGEFIRADVLELDGYDGSFDIVLCHDVIEHVGDKHSLLVRMARFLKPSGLLFVAFPAWQMPFGGHQQICRSRLLSHLPFIHLLPRPFYEALLVAGGESRECVAELMSIRSSRITVEAFESLATRSGLTVKDRRLYLVNPHYEVKFGLEPRLLPGILAGIPFVRNFFSTSCFYILQDGNR